jgi:uncharacterized iron-regulated membrane protein
MRRWLAWLHRWTGGLVGLWLAVLGLSGTILLWEESWISLPGVEDRLDADPQATGAGIEAALAIDPALSRITFADHDLGLHQAIFADGGGAYLSQAGEVVDRWNSLWGRPELWLFDLHHHLFMGETGETITGLLGILLFLFAVTGLILWWKTRRKFEFRLWPVKLSRSAIISQHRDIGVVASPLLIFSALTGTFMVFPSLSAALLAPWSRAAEAAPERQAGAIGPETDWRAVMTSAEARFPGALPRRIMFPKKVGNPIVLRLRQDFEWTPNGRTYVYLDPATARVIDTDDPATSDAASWIEEKYYPLHSAKVGGFLWKLALSFSGLTLVLLGTLATWSFWFPRAGKRKARRPISEPELVVEPAE